MKGGGGKEFRAYLNLITWHLNKRKESRWATNELVIYLLVDSGLVLLYHLLAVKPVFTEGNEG